jgi:hypothetical protein
VGYLLLQALYLGRRLVVLDEELLFLSVPWRLWEFALSSDASFASSIS